MTGRLAFLAAGTIALLPACASSKDHGSTALPASIEYRLAYDPTAPGAAWHVEVNGHGLASAKGLVLELDDWGEWTSVDSYYLRSLESDPPVRRVDGSRKSFTVEAPPDWAGELRLSYDLATTELGSTARENHGLLPYRAPTYAFGFSTNTLMTVAWTDMPADVERTIEIDAPRDWTIASGFADVSVHRQMARWAPSIGNTVISMGRPRGIAIGGNAAQSFTVVQWGGADERSASLLRFAQTYVAACTQSIGCPPTGPIQLIVTEPGFGGTRVDGAIAIGCPEGLDGDENAGTLHFLAHEMFLDWLGGRVRPASGGESLCWFWEGFTEYLSLWHLAKTGLVSRRWFAERMEHYEQIASAAKGRDEFKYADPNVPWRESDVEPLAYQGSALVAFSLDVALRRSGKPGLFEMIRDFTKLPGGRYTLDDIRAWVERHGLADFWRDHFETAPPHTVREDLLAIGFVDREAAEPLTYLGMRLDREGPFGAVVAVDPAGPANGLVRVGDVVNGLTPTRTKPAIAPEGIAADYRFGLGLYEPDAERVRVDVQRDGSRVEVWVCPRIIEGGVVRKLEPDDAKLDAFLR